MPRPRSERQSLEEELTVPTRAQQAGLCLEDVPRPSLAKLVRQYRLDAKTRRALKRVLRRRRPTRTV